MLHTQFGVFIKLNKTVFGPGKSQSYTQIIKNGTVFNNDCKLFSFEQLFYTTT